MARYDYGLRGPRDTMAPRLSRQWSGYSADSDDGPAARSNRVIRPSDIDLERPSGGHDARNPVPYGGEGGAQIEREDVDRTPRTARVEMRSGRGAKSPTPYDNRRHGLV